MLSTNKIARNLSTDACCFILRKLHTLEKSGSEIVTQNIQDQSDCIRPIRQYLANYSRYNVNF